MKNAHLESLRQLQLEHHRNHPWRLSQGGLFIPHSYSDITPQSLSSWDDVGFILNGRRVIVWWRHPRHEYSDAIWEQAMQEGGDGPEDQWLFEGGTKNYKRVGRSRKKLVSYTMRQPSKESKQHYDSLVSIRTRLTAEGIDLDVPMAWSWKRLRWAMGVSIVAPLEVRNEAELAVLAKLGRRLILGQTTLAREFPDYRFGRTEWLREQAIYAAQTGNSSSYYKQ